MKEQQIKTRLTIFIYYTYNEKSERFFYTNIYNINTFLEFVICYCIK